MTNTNRQPPLVRPLDQFDRQELVDVIVDILQALYLDCGGKTKFFWNPEMEWDVTTVDEVAAALRNHGLVLNPDSENGVAQQGPCRR